MTTEGHGHLAEIVKNVQGYEDSGQPENPGETYYDEGAGHWRLHHSHEDAADGIRGYMVEVMDVLKCHQDITICDSSGALRRYVAKYCSKFSDLSPVQN